MSTDMELASYPGLDERIVILRSGNLVDAVFVRTERFNVLIDTLETPEACRAALDLLGETVEARPLIVVNSHMDWDHFWGNSAVAGRGMIIAHERALERLRDPRAKQVLREKAAEDRRFDTVEIVPPTLTFSDRARLSGGDLSLELFHTPGHTPDHIAVWIPELRVCLAIDAVERPIPEVWSDDPHDLRALIASQQRIKRLKPEHVVLAHGRSSSPAVVDDNLRYFQTLAERTARLGTDLRLTGPALPEGLRLGDLVALPTELTPAELAFYEKCHRTNLRASLRSHRELSTG